MGVVIVSYFPIPLVTPLLHIAPFIIILFPPHFVHKLYHYYFVNIMFSNGPTIREISCKNIKVIFDIHFCKQHYVKQENNT